MALIKQHFLEFYSLINIHLYFIRMIQMKYCGSNLIIFESDIAHTSRVQAELGELPVYFSFSHSLRDTRTGPYPSISFVVSVCPAPQCQSEMLSSLRPSYQPIIFFLLALAFLFQSWMNPRLSKYSFNNIQLTSKFIMFRICYCTQMPYPNWY